MDNSNNITMNDLLAEWKLEHLLEKFKEEKITIDILIILQPHHVKKLFSSLAIGDAAKFEFELRNWKDSIERAHQTILMEDTLTELSLFRPFLKNRKSKHA